jgi:hypothetical protein
MVAKKKTKDTNSSATQSVKEPEIKPYLPEVEVWLNKLEINSVFDRNQIIEAIVFNAWEKSIWEGHLTSEYQVADAQTKIKIRSN